MNEHIRKVYCFLKIQFHSILLRIQIFWNAFRFLFLPVLTIGTLWVIFRTWKYPLLPDYFNLSNLEKNVFSNVFSSLTALSGIVIAVLLLSFEQFKNKLGESAISVFSSNKWLHLLVSTLVFSIIICFISLLLLPNNLKYLIQDLNLLYFCSILFIGNILFIFYASFQLIRSLSSEYNINKCIAKIEEVIYDSKLNIDWDKYYLGLAHANPYFILLNIIKAGILNMEFFTVAQTINMFTEKIIESINKNPHKIKDEHERQRFFERINHFYLITFRLGEKNNSTQFGELFSDNIQKIYKTSFKLQIPVHNLSSLFNGIISKSWENVINENYENEIQEHTRTIFFILQKYFESNPISDFKITSLKYFFSDKLTEEEKQLFPNEENNSEETRDWREISGVIPRFFSKYGILMIEQQKAKLYINYRKSLTFYLMELFVSKFSNYKASFIRFNLMNKLLESNFLALKTNLFNKEFYSFERCLFSEELFIEVINRSYPECTKIINSYFSCVKLVIKNNINIDWFLGEERYYFYGGELSQIIRSTLVRYAFNPSCEDILKIIVKFMDEAIEIIGTGKLENYPNLKNILIKKFNEISQLAIQYKAVLPENLLKIIEKNRLM